MVDIFRCLVQGDFFDWSSLNLAMFKTLYKIPYSNFFSWIFLIRLCSRPSSKIREKKLEYGILKRDLNIAKFRGDQSKKTPCRSGTSREDQ